MPEGTKPFRTRSVFCNRFLCRLELLLHQRKRPVEQDANPDEQDGEQALERVSNCARRHDSGLSGEKGGGVCHLLYNIPVRSGMQAGKESFLFLLPAWDARFQFLIRHCI